MEKPVPQPNGDSRPFWDGCNAGELRFQRCGACGQPQFYPRALCARCHATDLRWETSSGRGEIHSATTIHRGPTAAFKGAPYVLALVDMDEGFRIMANVLHADNAEIGERVRLVFEQRGDQKIPQVEKDG